MKKLTILALTAFAAAAITGCAQNKDAASADNGMAKATTGTCCGEKTAEAKAAGCCSGEAKASATCTGQAAQVK